jgi:hypothetical protein
VGIVKTLLKVGQDLWINIVNMPNDFNQTPLDVALKKQDREGNQKIRKINQEIIEILRNHGAQKMADIPRG